MKVSDIKIGQKYGRLAVVGFAGKDRKSNRLFFVTCECGQRETFIIYGSNLISGSTSSCGCKRREAHTTHSMSSSPEYGIWENMIQRCLNPNHDFYLDYGGRGISVCERWTKFENFYSDIGPRLSRSFTIDRINNDGNYEPGNVRWATRKEQANNRRPRSRRQLQINIQT